MLLFMTSFNSIFCMLQATARQSAAMPYQRRGLCSLAPLALAEEHLRTQARSGGPEDQEYNFAKRTHLSHVKSDAYVFEGRLKQGSSVNNRCGRRGGARPGHARHQNLAHRKESCHVVSRVTWNKHLIGRKLSSRVRGGYARGNRCRPRWTSRFPDPEGRESATPFPCWRAQCAVPPKNRRRSSPSSILATCRSRASELPFQAPARLQEVGSCRP
jgi:hypothetical protein